MQQHHKRLWKSIQSFESKLQRGTMYDNPYNNKIRRLIKDQQLQALYLQLMYAQVSIAAETKGEV